MRGPRYNTVMERCHPRTETVPLSFILRHSLDPDPYANTDLDVEKLDAVRNAIEPTLTGRKYEVLLLRSQGKSMAEIAMLLSVSKSTVRNYYLQAIKQVREALGVETEASRTTVGEEGVETVSPAKGC
ncbi:MAG: LuxR C-terminal-related transcriptional regulator [Gemmatimonadota bacterium]|nr:LuxR C-terminal-related transcriptional regulator [Gemmatimonadota bacterium]